MPITLVVIEGGTGPNVCSVPFDANTAISVGLLPEDLAILSLSATWLTSFSLESCINDRLLKTCIDDSFLYTSRIAYFLVTRLYDDFLATRLTDFYLEIASLPFLSCIE